MKSTIFQWEAQLTLSEFRTTLSVDQQQTLESQLELLSSETALTRQFVLNLHAECRLSSGSWSDVVTSICTADPNLDALVDAIKIAMRRHTLAGGSIPTPWPIHYGRVTAVDAFYDILIRAHKASSRLQAELVLSRLCRGPLDKVHKRLGRLKLGEFTFWATYHPHDADGHPFALLAGNADDVRCRLGLDRQDRGKKDLLLFVYALPAGNEPRYPTVADAYAGDTWLYFFRPAPTGEQSGRTMPWEDPDAPCLGEAPCREIVHAPTKGATLTEPPKIVLV